ncbi:MAG: hypothetical protein WAT71_02985 [Ignavibacteria bacterium]
MERRNKRDAKFLIFQSLYIIAISILFYKGTDLSLNKVTEINDSLIVVSKDRVLENGMISVDTTKQALKPKLPEGEKYIAITDEDKVISKTDYDELKNEAAKSKKTVIIDRTKKEDRSNKKTTSTTTIEGETPK